MGCVKKHTNKLTGDFVLLNLEEKKKLGHRSVVYLQARCGCFLKVTINGNPKTWVRQPERVKVPFRYGLYEYGHITEDTETRVPKG